MPDLNGLDLPAALTEGAAPARLLVGVLGLLLLIAGARLYRLAITGPGIAAGILAGLLLTEGAGTTVQLVAAGALGIIGGVILHLAERLAVTAAGALLVGGLTNAAAPLLMPGPIPWYVPVAGSLVGLLLFPRLYKALLPLITAVLGALAVVWAADRPQDLLLIGGLTAFGLLVQLFFRRRPRKEGG